jgi:hypothetical protein
VSPDDLFLQWRGPLDDAEMTDLVVSHGGTPFPGWWDRVRPHSFGWVTARDVEGTLIGFVNVVSHGDCHAFLTDTKTRGEPSAEASGRASSLSRPSRRGLRATNGSTSTSTTNSGRSTSTPAPSSRPRPA